MRVVCAQDNGFFEMKILNETSLIVGYFQSEYWATKSILEIREISLPETGLQQNFRDKPSNKVLALHIRLGDYLKEPKIGMLTDVYYISAIENVEKVKSIDEIWLFSDEPETAKEYIPQKWYSILKVIPEMSSAKTLNLMREADYYVISNSTFSWWGAFLSKSKDSTSSPPYHFLRHWNHPITFIPIDWMNLKFLI